VVRWATAIALIALLYAPTGIMRLVGFQRDVAARRVAPVDAKGALFRDIAAAIRASQPEGDIVMLASPNASTNVGYFGRFKTLGTLYWENDAGLHHAAEILGAKSEAEAAELIRKYHVTHLAMISEENFVVQYYQLLHPKATEEEIKKCFGWQILADKRIPQWLEMIPYSVPDDLKSLNISVMLFKVNFGQTLPEALYHVALSQVASGAVEEGERTFDQIIKLEPKIYQPWLRKSELLRARHDWAAAADATLKGISLAPANERPGLYVTYAGYFYTEKQPEFAIRLYRAGLAERFVPDLACYLAWILSTSPADALRNGPEALQLAEAAFKTNQTSPSYLNTLASALAENGRFPEAVQAADRALANSRINGDPPGVQAVFQRRLEVLRSGKPIRE
jgi:tetratricopeptide (TPR) repeat protein